MHSAFATVTPMWDQPATYTFRIPPALISKLNGSCKLFLRCGSRKDGSVDTVYEDKFPKSTKWYCNNRVVKEATHHRYRPVDVTEHVKGYDGAIVKKFSVQTYVSPGNNLNSFCVYIMVAQEVSAQTLLIPLRSVVPSIDACKQWVLRQLGGMASDQEICVGKEFIPLICPLSQMRMSLPSRGDQCKHVQCFDAEYYVMCNSRRTTFMCPICSKRVLIANLRRDTWLQDIISQTKSEVVEIELDVDGTWEGKTVDETVARKTATRRSDLGERRRKRQRAEELKSEKQSLGQMLLGSQTSGFGGVYLGPTGGARAGHGSGRSSMSVADMSSLMGLTGLFPNLVASSDATTSGSAASQNGTGRSLPVYGGAQCNLHRWERDDSASSLSPGGSLRGLPDESSNPFSSDIAHLMGALAHTESSAISYQPSVGDDTHAQFISSLTSDIGNGVVPDGSDLDGSPIMPSAQHMFEECEREMWGDMFTSSSAGMHGGVAANNPIFVVDSVCTLLCS